MMAQTRVLARHAGFTLLEVVIALALMAMALVIVYRAIGSGVHSISDTSRYTRAIALAESVLDLRQVVPAGGWSESGVWEDLQWSVSSTPFDRAPEPRIRLYRVEVIVSWSDGGRQRSFTLASLRPEEAASAKR